MSFYSLLCDSASIQRRTGTGKDNLGHPSAAFSMVAGNVRCRVSKSKGTEREDRATVPVSTHQIFFMSSVDVRESDRIEVDGDHYNVLLVRRIKGIGGVHHLEVDVRHTGQ